jgi:hypothetical protein
MRSQHRLGLSRGRRTTLHLEKPLDMREDIVAVDFDQNPHRHPHRRADSGDG